jgi:RHS repeat-associated protein
LKTWLEEQQDFATGARTQITRTVYDELYGPVNNANPGTPNGDYLQTNLRNRVSYTMVIKNLNDVTGTKPFENATFYSYDAAGNVNDLLQDYLGIADISGAGQRHKRIQYRYDLVSGKVNEVWYQHRSDDAFYHKYLYDAENRLTGVQTSRDQLYWEADASYKYYRHGPLARTELGSLKVQGLDYAYTLQGWLKTINGNEVTDGTTDMGGDGRPSNPQNPTARDVVALGLHYYQGDYKAIGEATAITGKLHSNIWNLSSTGFGQLYNGNIAAITEHNTRLGLPLAFRYRYDQLNRLVNMDAFNNPWTAAPVRTQDYQENITYDPNGNILTYQRNAAEADRGLLMDNLFYNYDRNEVGRLKSNKLLRVEDEVSDNNHTEDIKNQISNYEYDAIGNLTKDENEKISNIKWTVYGKIESITKTDGSTLAYTYDASGNRIEKKYSKAGDDHYTWYVRDAQGNTMAVYEKKGSTSGVRHTETHLYGSSRLGIAKEPTKKPGNVNVVNAPANAKANTFTRGEKFFELTNHLGNVLAVVSDKKLPVKATIDNSINFWQADVVNATDYYPFGMPMPGRNGIAFQSDWVPGRGFVAGNSYPDYLQVSSRPYAPTPNVYQAGVEVELLPGFETATATDELTVQIEPGSGVLNNEYEGGEGSDETYGYYRYGFNGKENDNEVKGSGNTLNYEFREYDPRIGRFNSVDPKSSEYGWQSPYVYHRNSPIFSIDYLGLGDPPTTAYHNTSIADAAKIVNDGTFKAGNSGWNYFMTDPSGTKAGSDVAKAPVQFKIEVNMAGAKEISYKQWDGFFKQAKSQMGLSDVANNDLTTGQLKELNAIRNQKAVTFMNSIEGADAFIINAEKGSTGQKFYALKDKSILSRVSSKMQTTRGGNQLVSSILSEGLKRKVFTYGKALLRVTGEAVIIESTILAFEKQHQANKQYVEKKKQEGKNWLTDTYSSTGLLYWLFSN